MQFAKMKPSSDIYHNCTRDHSDNNSCNDIEEEKLDKNISTNTVDLLESSDANRLDNNEPNYNIDISSIDEDYFLSSKQDCVESPQSGSNYHQNNHNHNHNHKKAEKEKM